PGLRALILLLACLGAALGERAYLPACFGRSVLAGNPQSGSPALPGPLQGLAAQSSPAQTADCETIPFAKAIERELSDGEKHCFSFTVGAGQFVQAAVAQRGIDVVVTIFGPDGDQMKGLDRANGMYGPESVSLIAPSSGVYRLQIKSSKGESNPGRYRVTLNEPRAVISSDEKRIAAEKLIVEAGDLKSQNTADTLRRGGGEKKKARGALEWGRGPRRKGATA